MRIILCLLFPVFLGGCMGYPDTVEPVRDFELDRYLGKWYEIARLDHPFERGLERVSAEYSMRQDGGVKVVNRGYSPETDEWKEAVGKAYFASETGVGYLKVSFFGPFYGSYVIFELDKDDYQYAYVTGPDTSYLWLLAREPVVGEARKADFIAKAKAAGYEVEGLIWVEQGE